MRKSASRPLRRWKISAPALRWQPTIWRFAGPGELLGEDQSGQMETIGFSLYMELLENAVDALKAGREPSLGRSHQSADGG
ncbi:transcription-repair coupling factor [Klebsiella pneumoniae]|uniref:Transcription-repair coupling factor n=1 Tax=Klebsiella pneumoniae TaxID=573 RepID=A0A378F635_KLEPN|nr:transcription-repair coupling factor [Klebsiella pneumoniae]